MSKDKRQFPRKKTDESADISAGDEVYAGTIKDISKGGAAVEFRFPSDLEHRPFDIGSHVELSPEKSDPKSGYVVRQYVNGVGLEFDPSQDKK